jgi:anti-sigma B factor antagonist
MMFGEKISVTIERNSGSDSRIIAVKGIMDAVTSKQVDDNLLPVIDEGNSNIVLDLTDLEYVSSAGIMCLIRYHVLMVNKQKQLKLVKPPDPVHNTLKIAGIAKYFSIHDNVQEALAAFH